MKIDYKKELESASRSMIMIHDHNMLIKLIVRMIVQKLDINHAAMLIYEPAKDCYVLGISRGQSGYKIPTGFTRFTNESPIIRVFQEDNYRTLLTGRNALVSDDISKMVWKDGIIDQSKNGNGHLTAETAKNLLFKVDEQMKMLNSTVCVPAFYQNDLLAVLLLGEKNSGTKFDQQELDFFAALAHDTAMAIRNAQLFESLQKEASRNKDLFLQTIIVLGSAIEAKDSYTHGHTERVTKYSIAIAKQMVTNGTAKFNKAFLDNLYISGLLHDIGKIAVPEAVLNKKGKLTDREYEELKNHTVKGAEMVKPLSLAKEVIDGIKYHHERFDGFGYPDGLVGQAIPITAAILAVADTYDAMTSDRPYRKGLAKEVALQEIIDNDGKQFNPLPVRAMIELYKRGMI